MTGHGAESELKSRGADPFRSALIHESGVKEFCPWRSDAMRSTTSAGLDSDSDALDDWDSASDALGLSTERDFSWSKIGSSRSTDRGAGKGSVSTAATVRTAQRHGALWSLMSNQHSTASANSAERLDAFHNDNIRQHLDSAVLIAEKQSSPSGRAVDKPKRSRQCFCFSGFVARQ